MVRWALAKEEKRPVLKLCERILRGWRKLSNHAMLPTVGEITPPPGILGTTYRFHTTTGTPGTPGAAVRFRRRYTPVVRLRDKLLFAARLKDFSSHQRPAGRIPIADIDANSTTTEPGSQSKRHCGELGGGPNQTGSPPFYCQCTPIPRTSAAGDFYADHFAKTRRQSQRILHLHLGEALMHYYKALSKEGQNQDFLR